MELGFFENVTLGGILDDATDFAKSIFVAREQSRVAQTNAQTAQVASSALQQDATERYRIMMLVVAVLAGVYLYTRRA